MPWCCALRRWGRPFISRTSRAVVSHPANAALPLQKIPIVIVNDAYRLQPSDDIKGLVSEVQPASTLQALVKVG